MSNSTGPEGSGRYHDTPFWRVVDAISERIDRRVGWDRLLFATDYPHWDYDDPSRVLPAGVSEANREAFYLNNALKLYGLS